MSIIANFYRESGKNDICGLFRADLEWALKWVCDIIFAILFPEHYSRMTCVIGMTLALYLFIITVYSLVNRLRNNYKLIQTELRSS